METPGLDRLAAHGSVFDQHFAEVPGYAGPDHSWWTGQFEYFAPTTQDSAQAHRAESGNCRPPDWLKLLSDHGVKCRLVAENTEGIPTELFYSSEAVGGVTGLNARHDDVPIARLIQRGLEILNGPAADSSPELQAQQTPRELIWLHSAGVPSPWLPPRFFAELYLDELEEIVDGESGSEIASELVEQFEDDPNLVRLLLSEWRREATNQDDLPHPSATDPDDIESPELERQISRLVFAGYVSMIDRWILRLVDALERSSEPTLLVVSSNQGHSFGETEDLVDGLPQPVTLEPDSQHSGIGKARSDSLVDAEVRTPLLLAEFSGPSQSNAFGSRHSALTQPIDLPVTVSNWFGIEIESAGHNLLPALAGDTPAGHSQACSLAADQQMRIRSRSWSLRTSAEALTDEDRIHSELSLFAKPDDQWDVHDVASQFREEVDSLLNLLRKRLPVRR